MHFVLLQIVKCPYWDWVCPVLLPQTPQNRLCWRVLGESGSQCHQDGQYQQTTHSEPSSTQASEGPEGRTEISKWRCNDKVYRFKRLDFQPGLVIIFREFEILFISLQWYNSLTSQMCSAISSFLKIMYRGDEGVSFPRQNWDSSTVMCPSASNSSYKNNKLVFKHGARMNFGFHCCTAYGTVSYPGPRSVCAA